MTQALMPIENDDRALLAVATLDGIAGAAIWARRLSPLKSFLFAAEGKTGDLFQIPALTNLPDLRQLYCLGLSLTDDDLPAVLNVLEKRRFSEAIWLDHHVMNPQHVAELSAHGVQVINKYTFDRSCDLLAASLEDADDLSDNLCRFLGESFENADEPWLSWLYVFLAVRDDLFTIRHAIQPLIENRLEAYDPALRQAGEKEWENITHLAKGNFHDVQVGERRFAVLGLASSQRNNYRLIADHVMLQRDVDLGLVFFDDLNRLVLRRPPTRDGIDLWALAEKLEAHTINVFLYDRNTVFLEPPQDDKLQAIEETLDLISSFYS